MSHVSWMAFCTSGSAAKTLALNPGGSFISAIACSAVIGGAPVPPGTVLVLMIWGNWAAPSVVTVTNDNQRVSLMKASECDIHH